MAILYAHGYGSKTVSTTGVDTLKRIANALKVKIDDFTE